MPRVHHQLNFKPIEAGEKISRHILSSWIEEQSPKYMAYIKELSDRQVREYFISNFGKFRAINNNATRFKEDKDE